MQLVDVPGHDHIKEYFRKIVAENRVPHALLLTGPKGNGKRALALSLAQLLLCKNPQNQSACGVCGACLKTTKIIHPDLHFTFPVKSFSDKKLASNSSSKAKKRDDITSKDYIKEWRTFVHEEPFGDMEKWTHFLDGGDKNFNINVKECSDIAQNLLLQSFEGKYKIQIIWAAEYLGREGNRLLKLIEEPTDNTIIILICENQEMLLNTVLSRCQIVQVPPIKDSAIAEYLKQNTEISEERRKEIVYLVSGNLDSALDLAKGEEINFSEELLNWLRVAHQGSMGKILGWIDPMIKNGKAVQKAFFLYGLHFFQEYIKSLHLNSLDTIRLKDEEKNTILKMQRIIDIKKAEKLIEILNESIYNLGRNANNKMLFIHQTYCIESILKS